MNFNEQQILPFLVLITVFMLIYGVGGIIAPFVGIKIIDMALELVGLV